MPKAATEKKYIVPKQTHYSPAVHRNADHVMREMDRVIRWKKIHALLRRQNKQARKEQDKTAEDCKYFREHGLIRKDKSKILGLRFGVSLPPMTYQALVQADRLIEGHSELANPSKEEHSDIKGSNQIVKDLAKAFPQYKVN